MARRFRGATLRRLRLRAGLKPAALAARAELSPLTIKLLEANWSRPHPATLRKLARALRVKIDVLLDGA